MKICGSLGSVLRIRGWASWPTGVRGVLAGLGLLVLLLVAMSGAGFGALLAEDSGVRVQAWLGDVTDDGHMDLEKAARSPS
jgi:hypothetical protein